MTSPAEEQSSEPLGLTETPADEHPSELPGEADDAADGRAVQQENAGTSADQPSDDSGGG